MQSFSLISFGDIIFSNRKFLCAVIILYALVKALLRVHYEKVVHGHGQGTNAAQVSSVLGSRPMPECYKCGSTLTGLKHFWSTNSSFWQLLVIRKCYAPVE